MLPDGTDVEGKRHTYPEMAAAGLWTTAEDLARFALEVQAGLRGEGEALSQPMVEAMLEPVDPRFGRGFALSERDGHRYFSHNGWDEGFCTLFLASRDGGQGVVVMINSNHPAFMDEVANGIAYANSWPGYEAHVAQGIPSSILEGVSGRYRYNAETALTVYRDGNRLFLQYVGADPEELLLAGDGLYRRRTRPTPIVFTVGDDGAGFSLRARCRRGTSVPRRAGRRRSPTSRAPCGRTLRCRGGGLRGAGRSRRFPG